MPLDQLDDKLVSAFKGYTVKKDLVRKLKSGYNVPNYVLEYLVASKCSSSDLEAIKAGMEEVKDVLSSHFVQQDESEKIRAQVREKDGFRVIDKISVELDEKKDKYFAELFNSGIKKANIDPETVMDHEKMLTGGIWAIVKVGYNPDIIIDNTKYPFVIRDINPIQLSRFGIADIQDVRSEFTREEWIDVLVRSIGLEPKQEDLDQRQKMLHLSRLIPLVEENFNMIELGPRSTGKSYVFRELSPYSILISGGKTTVAKLFVNLNTGQVGLVGMWDTIAFDEVAGMKFKDAEVIQILKDYMESGSFSRGKEEITADGSIVMNGNINTEIDTLRKTSHLFEPMPEDMIDTALIDRLHLYLPGWEVKKLSPEHFTDHFGLSIDYFSQLLRQLRDYSYADSIDQYFGLGSHLNQRDSRAVRKTVSGLVKLIHPDDDYSKEDLVEYMEFAMEGRRRIKEQLKRLGGIEFFNTNFSYIDKETQEEKYVSVPEEGGSELISPDPLPPGTVYTVGETEDGHSLIRIECKAMSGNGNLKITGTNKTDIKNEVKTAKNYIKANSKRMLPENKSFDGTDLHVQLSPLLGGELGESFGVAALVSILSAMFEESLIEGVAVLGNLSIGGVVSKEQNLADKVQLLSENGAKSVFLPLENSQDIPNIPQGLLSDTDPKFYDEPQKAFTKALLNG